MTRKSTPAKKKTTRVYDVAVKVGSYEKDGETKGRYENVGVVLEGENGMFMLMKRTFNPAGVDTDGDRIILSFFEPESEDSKS